MYVGRTAWVCSIVLVVLILAVVWGVPRFVSKERKLYGVLVDLELGEADPSRYGELQDALERRLSAEVASLSHLRVVLDYVHFSNLESAFFDTHHVDFVILSPQGTPWHRYYHEAAPQMAAVKGLLKEVIFNRNMPVLGVCGGHQFLAMTFGSSVDFMDTRFAGSTPDVYPKEALAERGSVHLETLADDPIFDGVVSHPGTFLVMESHREEVKSVPSPFVNLARSRLSEIQLLRIPGRIVYGTAFHPERGWYTPDGALVDAAAGKQILTNFLRMVAQGA